LLGHYFVDDHEFSNSVLGFQHNWLAAMQCVVGRLMLSTESRRMHGVTAGALRSHNSSVVLSLMSSTDMELLPVPTAAVLLPVCRVVLIFRDRLRCDW